jgi:hypothetical protein
MRRWIQLFKMKGQAWFLDTNQSGQLLQRAIGKTFLERLAESSFRLRCQRPAGVNLDGALPTKPCHPLLHHHLPSAVTQLTPRPSFLWNLVVAANYGLYNPDAW